MDDTGAAELFKESQYLKPDPKDFFQRLANNHEICNLRIGHGLEPKIFWVRKSGQGSQRKTSFTADLDPDG